LHFPQTRCAPLRIDAVQALADSCATRCSIALRIMKITERIFVMKSFTSIVAATLLLALSGLAQAGNSILIITHEVKDFATWKVGYDNDQPNRDKAGLVERFLVRDADQPNVVTIGLEAPDANAAGRFSTNLTLSISLKLDLRVVATSSANGLALEGAE
jgi:hypothetical protein